MTSSSDQVSSGIIIQEKIIFNNNNDQKDDNIYLMLSNCSVMTLSAFKSINTCNSHSIKSRYNYVSNFTVEDTEEQKCYIIWPRLNSNSLAELGLGPYQLGYSLSVTLPSCSLCCRGTIKGLYLMTADYQHSSVVQKYFSFLKFSLYHL